MVHREGGFCRQFLSPLNVLALVISAYCHDVDHPGLNARFLQRTRHHLAITYNDRSPLENHHASLSFKVMLKEENNFLEPALSKEQFDEFRESMIGNILVTDMGA